MCIQDQFIQQCLCSCLKLFRGYGYGGNDIYRLSELIIGTRYIDVRDYIDVRE